MADFTFHDKSVILMIKLTVLGGAERQALGLADFLIKNYNCKVHLVVTHYNQPTKEFHDFAIACGIDIIHYFGEPSLTIKREISLINFKKAIRALRYLRLMKKKLAQFQPDIIIPFLNTPSKITALIYKSVGAKFAFWHQLGLDVHSYDILENRAIKSIPFFIANAENGVEVFQNYYKVPKEKLFILPQYVSIKKINLDKISLKEKFKISEDSIVIGMIAHYRKEKYQDLLIRAFSEVKTLKKIHLVLLGNKDNNVRTLDRYNELIDLSKRLNCFDRISFLSGESVEEVLNCLDIGVLVSEIEGTPTVVMEYMLYDLPIVSTNHIGCMKLMESSEYLIPNDKDILKLKLQELVNDELLREKEKINNSEKIKKFSKKNYVIKLQEIINKSKK